MGLEESGRKPTQQRSNLTGTSVGFFLDSVTTKQALTEIWGILW